MPIITFHAPFEVTTSLLAGRLRLENGDFVLPLENGTATYTGTNLSISPVGGTIETYEETRNGSLVYSITGLSIDASVLFTRNITADQVFNLFYGGNDSVFGSNGRDVIDTLGGRDVIEAGGGNDEIRAGRGNDRVDGGSGRDTLFGLSGRDFIFGGTGADIINGGSGNDTLRGGGSGDRIIGGAGNDDLSGQAGNDTLLGGGGNDTLDGGGGRDRMAGGDGNDTYLVNAQGDTVVEEDGEGRDRVVTQLNAFTLAENVEDLDLTGRRDVVGIGNALDNRIAVTGDARSAQLSGEAGDDTLIGGDGDDTLDGGTDADEMIGGDGDDYYFVDNAEDIVTELADGGDDTVETALNDYGLAENVETLILTGDQEELVGSGNDGDNLIIGSALAGRNRLFGQGGDDELRGAAQGDDLDGGAGDDTMIGGAGSDTYFVEQLGDTVVELEGEGTDTVYTTLLDYTLGDNVEDLVIVSFEEVSDDIYRGTGNALDNSIAGVESFGNDLLGLDGNDEIYGGRLADFLSGGNGNDRLEGGAGRDQLLGGADDDLLIGGAAGDTLNGGDGNDTLQGDGGQDLLDGGAGDDLMEGGAGDDTYLVDSQGDDVVEAEDDGFDTVRTTLTDYTLSANVENLVLMGFSADEGQLYTGTGNALDNDIRGSEINGNVLFGLAGNDVLNGGDSADTLNGGDGDDVIIGGADADILTGGDGADIFVFDFIEDSRIETGDVITDFVQGEDVIEFGTLIPGLHIDLLTIDPADGLLGLYHVSGPDAEIPTSDIVIVSEIVGENTIIRMEDNDPEAGVDPLDLDFEITILGAFTLTIDDFSF